MKTIIAMISILLFAGSAFAEGLHVTRIELVRSSPGRTGVVATGTVHFTRPSGVRSQAQTRVAARSRRDWILPTAVIATMAPTTAVWLVKTNASQRGFNREMDRLIGRLAAQ
jgi:hypothetical protein